MGIHDPIHAPGAGAVSSVNTKTGVVVLNTDDIDEAGTVVTVPITNKTVMAAGDSLAWGYPIQDTHAGYRQTLFNLCKSAGMTITFVGIGEAGPTMTDPAWTRKHEGWAGYKISAADTVITPDVGTFTPDIVLLCIGTNDAIQSDNVATAHTRIDTFLDNIRGAHPTAQIYLALLPPLANATWNANINTINGNIPAMVAAYNAAHDPDVTIVDMNAVVPVADLSDGIHPGLIGYTAMAQAWRDAIIGASGSGTFLEEADHKWFTADRVMASKLTGLNVSSSAILQSSDSLIVALGKIEKRLRIVEGICDVVPPIETGFPLTDVPNAWGAYSIARQIRASHTTAILKVRDETTNVETDIGVDSSGNLDVAAIIAACSTHNGLITTIYDQSGNGKNLTQADEAKMPKIYDGTAVLLGETGNPAAFFDGTDDYLKTAQDAALTQSIMCYFVGEMDAWTNLDRIWDGYNYDSGVCFEYDAANRLTFYSGGTPCTDVTDNWQTDTVFLCTVRFDGASSYIQYNNGTERAPGNPGTASMEGLSLGAAPTGAAPAAIRFSEMIIYKASHTSDTRTTLANNLNAYYGIY